MHTTSYETMNRPIFRKVSRLDQLFCGLWKRAYSQCNFWPGMEWYFWITVMILYRAHHTKSGQPLTFTKYFLICILVLIFRLFHGPAVDFIWRMQWWCANKIDEHIKFVEVEKILDTVESAEVAQVLENARINGFEQFFGFTAMILYYPETWTLLFQKKMLK